MPNKRGVQIVGGRGFSENLIKGGLNKRGEGKLRNPYLKIRYNIIFVMPIPKLIHSFSTSI